MLSFPGYWNMSFITPIYKSGNSRTAIKNCRDVCRSSYIPKIFEGITAEKLFRSTKNLIREEQHCFFQGRSICINFFLFSEYVNNAFLSVLSIDCLHWLGYSFDCVNISRLLWKLEQIGICNQLLRWLTNCKNNKSFVYWVPRACLKVPMLGNFFFFYKWYETRCEKKLIFIVCKWLKTIQNW